MTEHSESALATMNDREYWWATVGRVMPQMPQGRGVYIPQVIEILKNQGQEVTRIQVANVARGSIKNNRAISAAIFEVGKPYLEQFHERNEGLSERAKAATKQVA